MHTFLKRIIAFTQNTPSHNNGLDDCIRQHTTMNPEKYVCVSTVASLCSFLYFFFVRVFLGTQNLARGGKDYTKVSEDRCCRCQKQRSKASSKERSRT